MSTSNEYYVRTSFEANVRRERDGRPFGQRWLFSAEGNGSRIENRRTYIIHVQRVYYNGRATRTEKPAFERLRFTHIGGWKRMLCASIATFLFYSIFLRNNRTRKRKKIRQTHEYNRCSRTPPVKSSANTPQISSVHTSRARGCLVFLGRSRWTPRKLGRTLGDLTISRRRGVKNAVGSGNWKKKKTISRP